MIKNKDTWLVIAPHLEDVKQLKLYVLGKSSKNHVERPTICNQATTQVPWAVWN